MHFHAGIEISILTLSDCGGQPPSGSSGMRSKAAQAAGQTRHSFFTAAASRVKTEAVKTLEVACDR